MRSYWRKVWVALFCCAAGGLPVVAMAEPSCEGKLRVWTRKAALLLDWSGEITEPMAACIQAEFDKVRGRVRKVQLLLNSPGGPLAETERTVATLRKIRETHELSTAVLHGHICGSGCVPVFLTGKNRYAAFASLWFFHEVGRWASDGSNKYRIGDRVLTDHVFEEYFAKAGVSEAWLDRLYMVVSNSDYWQTGQNLWDDKSGIITHTLGNLVPRKSERPKY